MDRVGCVVIGAGVVGLSVARAIAETGRETIVVEQHGGIGTETSARNSEVIHAGLYYPTGSHKTRLCVTGRDMLYRYCEDRGIAHQRCGKLIVATSEAQLPALQAIAEQARVNNCGETPMRSADEAKALEPALSCVAALHSPMTGIIDSHAYMLSLQGDAERAGATFAFGSKVQTGYVTRDGIVLKIRSEYGDGADDVELLADQVINCAGLWAPSVAATISGLDSASIPTAYFAKGNYFSLHGASPFSRLIYPVPEPGGLGVHLTLDLANQARFGPDVEWFDVIDQHIDYRVDPRRAERFHDAIRRYWPAMPDDALQPAYSGVRPKISGPDQVPADFLFSSHGAARYLGLYGIESPGLTASLAIAEHVLKILERHSPMP